MSKHINVNPDHYKVAGRERPGKAAAQVNQEVNRTEQEERERWAETKKNKEKVKK